MDSLNTKFKAEQREFDGPVLVTGAGGCIGSWVLAILQRAGIPAVALDLREDRRRPGLLMSREQLADVAWCTGDIGDTQTVDAVVAEHGIGAIVHLAALQVPFCKADPIGGARVNVVGTVGIFEAARRHGVRRVTYASSIAAHGVLPDSPYLATLYGAYKRCDESLAGVYFQDWGVPSVGIRPGVVYGVGRDQGMTSKTTVAILAAAAGRPYTVPFCGPTDYLYAGEVAAAFVRAVARDGTGAHVFDLNGRAASVEDGLAILRRLAPAARLDATGAPLPFPSELPDRPLRALIGDFGAISLEDGIEETYRAFRALLADGRISTDDID